MNKYLMGNHKGRSREATRNTPCDGISCLVLKFVQQFLQILSPDRGVSVSSVPVGLLQRLATAQTFLFSHI